MIAGVKKADQIILHAQFVDRIGTPSLQMILAISLYCREHDKNLMINQPSEAFINCAQILGLVENFKQWGDLYK